MDAEQDKKDKAAFAAFLLQTKGDAFAAAQLLFPANVGAALRISQYWPVDKFVIEERARLESQLTANDPDSVKQYVSRKAREVIDATTTVSTKDRLAAMELLAKLHGVLNDEPFTGDLPPLPLAPTYKVVLQ